MKVLYNSKKNSKCVDVCFNCKSVILLSVKDINIQEKTYVCKVCKSEQSLMGDTLKEIEDETKTP